MVHNLKITVGATCFVYIFLATLVTNAVVLIFWSGHTLHLHGNRLGREVAALGRDSFASDLQSRLNRHRLHQLSTDYDIHCAYFGAQWLAASSACAEVLKKGVAAQTWQNSIGKAGTASGGWWVASHYLHVVVYNSAGTTPDWLGVSVPLTSVLKEVWEREKVIFGYLLLNSIFLSTVLFFRFSAKLIRPIDQLVERADKFSGDDLEMLVDNTATGELGQLSRSINGMLERIQQDKHLLEVNIAQLQQANLDLENNRKEMVRTEKLAVTGRLAAGVAHEIGNPVSIISGYLELLKKEDVSNREKNEYIRRSEEELLRVNTLVRQLSDCMHPVALPKTTFSIHALINCLIETVFHKREYRNIGVKVQLEAERDAVYGTVDYLRQVLLNCLFNALDAVGENEAGSKGEIIISTKNMTKDAGSFVAIAIQDNGVGLPPDQQACMFDPFFTTKEPGKGTGLGLAVSRAIIDSMGGEMAFESNGQTGSMMNIILPAADHRKNEQ